MGHPYLRANPASFGAFDGDDALGWRVRIMTDGSGSVPRSTGQPYADPATADGSPKSVYRPWITWIAIIACIGIYVGLAVENDYESWESLAKWGYIPAISIWDGAYWALLSSVFVHFEIWHLAFNVYWLWVLGSRLEQAIRALPFLCFFIVSAFVSSSFELAVSDDTGIGASGVVYAIFGFMWVARNRLPQLKGAIDRRTINLFLLWLVGCVVVTYLGVWNVGNAAHVSGLLVGAAASWHFVLRYKPPLTLAALLAIVVLAAIPLFWCPWSVTWLTDQAYRAHVAGRHNEALKLYSRIIRIDPDNAWAYQNRSDVYEELGQDINAQADLQKARELDPSIEEPE